MPKVLLYTTARITWIFLFFGTDVNESRAHVHVSKKGMDSMCKIWLEPSVSVADAGVLTPSQIKQILVIASDNKELLLKQWKRFKSGDTVKMTTINK